MCVGQLSGDLPQGGALVQALGPVAVGGQVLITEVEPGDPRPTVGGTPSPARSRLRDPNLYRD